MSMKNFHIGIVGGMGPVASAAFLNSIYEHNLVEREREHPNITLLADTSAPPRSKEDVGRLTAFLNEKLALLEKLGATHTIVCCLVAHALPLADAPSRLSLSRLVRAEFDRHSGRVFVIGSRLLSEDASVQETLFGRPLKAEELPSRADQEKIFQLIDAIKLNRNVDDFLPGFQELLHRAQDRRILLCCGELHAASRRLNARPAAFDPFLAAINVLKDLARDSTGTSSS